ncbi:MAG: LLM class flavin-dependent oxidoreductase [Candidatus Tectomicrobia bacterium]|nr:LLM class flavin-dependent oxidoreductase [Candidatus Tectomicrobia bacterium]
MTPPNAAPPQVAVSRPTVGAAFHMAPGEELFRLAERLERAGYDALWVGDHMAVHGPVLEPFILLAALASRTQRIRLGTSVYVLPLRHPAVVAKLAASLDFLSNGRLILGVGVGGEFPKEFELCGVPLRQRGRRAAEALAVLRALWRDGESSFHGEFAAFDGVTMLPKPLQPGGVPLWGGGRSEAALRRAARHCDGWLSYAMAPDRLAESLRRIQAYAEEAGRALDQFTVAHQVWLFVDGDEERAFRIANENLSHRFAQPFAARTRKLSVLGPPEACREKLAAYHAAGVRHFIIDPVCPEALADEQLERFAEELAPRLREFGAAA